MGEGVRMSHLARTPAQRRADALVEMARRSVALPGGSRLPAAVTAPRRPVRAQPWQSAVLPGVSGLEPLMPDDWSRAVTQVQLPLP